MPVTSFLLSSFQYEQTVMNQKEKLQLKDENQANIHTGNKDNFGKNERNQRNSEEAETREQK